MRHAIPILIALLLVGLAAPAGALPILYLDNLLHGTSVGFWYNGSNYSGIWAGSVDARLDGADLPPIYCVDLDHFIQIPTSYPVQVLSTNSLANGARAAWLYNNFGGTTQDQQAAALQLALWDVVYDAGDGFATGLFRYSGGLSGQAGQYLNASAGGSDVASLYDPPGNQQSFIGPIPEPGSLYLLLLGGAFALTPVSRRLRRS